MRVGGGRRECKCMSWKAVLLSKGAARPQVRTLPPSLCLQQQSPPFAQGGPHGPPLAFVLARNASPPLPAAKSQAPLAVPLAVAVSTVLML